MVARVANFVSKRLQVAVAAILCLMFVRLATGANPPDLAKAPAPAPAVTEVRVSLASQTVR